MKGIRRLMSLMAVTVFVSAVAVSCGGGGGGGGAATTTTPSPPATPATLNLATLRADGYYFNVHTANFPDGEIRGQVHVDPAASGTVTISTPMSGGQEVPPVATAGTGTGTLVVDLSTGAVSGISVTYSGLSGPATTAHLHEAAAGVNGPVVVPITLPAAVPPTTPLPGY